MKSFLSKMKLVILLSIVCIVSSQPTTNNDDTNFEYPRYITFPDGDGNPHLVDLEQTEDDDAEIEEIIERNEDINKYFLYSSFNPRTAKELFNDDVDSIRNSHFDPRLPTIAVVHGWLSDSDTDINPAIRNAFLRNFDVNLIVVEWRRIAVGGYATAVRGVPGVGRHFGRFLQFLNGLGASYSTMHLVGFSLGAHVVGNAGRFVNSRVGRITGLDPAGPLWLFNNDRLSSTDGVYVEAIHTDGGYTAGGLGIGRDIAQVDFYPNGGISQPGCLTNICNHNRAWEFFAASVAYNHLFGNRCDSSTQLTMNLCRGPQLAFGNGFSIKSGSGTYRVNTDRNYPFGNIF